jgi:uncharacterized protein
LQPQKRGAAGKKVRPSLGSKQLLCSHHRAYAHYHGVFMNGRFLISRSTDEQFYFNLLAGNGERILTSELYAAKQSAHTGIASVKMNAPIDQQYDRRIDTQGKPYFVLKAKNGEIIGKSESYSSTAATEKGIQSVKTNAPSAVTEDESQPA